MDVTPDGDFQVSEDLPFQMREFAAQRIARIGVLVVIAAALLGLLGGSGPFATARAGDAAGGVLVEFDRLAHVQRPTSLRLRALAGPDERELALHIGSAYLDRVTVTSITPEPKRVEAAADGLRFVFATEPGAALDAAFSIQADTPGAASAEVRRAGHAVRFTQFVYP